MFARINKTANHKEQLLRLAIKCVLMLWQLSRDMEWYKVALYTISKEKSLVQDKPPRAGLLPELVRRPPVGVGAWEGDAASIPHTDRDETHTAALNKWSASLFIPPFLYFIIIFQFLINLFHPYN